MLQKLQNFAKLQKMQLDNLADFAKCCKMRIYLQRSAPIQPKTSEILPTFSKIWQLAWGQGRPGLREHSATKIANVATSAKFVKLLN